MHTDFFRFKGYGVINRPNASNILLLTQRRMISTLYFIPLKTRLRWVQGKKRLAIHPSEMGRSHRSGQLLQMVKIGKGRLISMVAITSSYSSRMEGYKSPPDKN